MTTTPTFEIAQWGAAHATAALATQVRNRPVSWATVRRYRNDMAAGRWTLNGEGIIFDPDGRLIDGQHRLHALAELPDTTVTLAIVRGVSESAQLTMNQGRKRSAGQQLQMLGVLQGNIVASGVRNYLALTTGLLFRDNKLVTETITTPLVEEWVEKNRDKITALNGMVSDMRKADAPSSVAYCAALMFHDKSPEHVAEFFHLLAHGAGGPDHPITVLDKRLQRHRREGIRISNRDMLGLYVQAWNAWRKGLKLTKFQRPRGGHWTEKTFPAVSAA